VTDSIPLHRVIDTLERLAPLELAESWDNVGLLVGDQELQVRRVMTCLTVTATTVQEAIERRVDLLLPHHPIPFKPLSRITTEQTTGKLLLEVIRNSIAIYSMHTAWDNAPTGINRQLARCLDLQDSEPLTLSTIARLREANLGSGICGRLSSPMSVADIQCQLEAVLPIKTVRHTHSADQRITKLGIVCGSGGSLLGLAAQRGCDGFLTGEATYHHCLESEALGVATLMIGHHASEFFAMQNLATHLAQELPSIECFASTQEYSPF
jgi:dinuclear metal center YbgI/SA1388 family protein